MACSLSNCENDLGESLKDGQLDKERLAALRAENEDRVRQFKQILPIFIMEKVELEALFELVDENLVDFREHEDEILEKCESLQNRAEKLQQLVKRKKLLDKQNATLEDANTDLQNYRRLLPDIARRNDLQEEDVSLMGSLQEKIKALMAKITRAADDGTPSEQK